MEKHRDLMRARRPPQPPGLDAGRMTEPLTRDTVCTPEMVRVALQLSERQWARKQHLLPWSYAFGDRCRRIAWGTVLDFITARKTA